MSSDFFGWKNADDGPERSLNSHHQRDDWIADEDDENEEEEEVPLEIEDFGCETSFEVTCMAIEEFLRSEVAKLTKDGLNRDHRHSLRKVSTISACSSFSLKMPFAVKEFSTERGDALEISIFHNAYAHPISKWTGLSTFAIVKGRINTNPTRSDSCLYLSYLTCACDALGLPMACFTPTGDAHRETFVGYGRNPPTVSRFSLEVFPQGPPLQCRSLSGLVDLLLLNIGLQSRVCEDRNGSSVLLDHERVYRLPIATIPLGSAAAGALYASPPSTSSPTSVTSTQFLDERHVWVDALRAMNEACLERCGAATVPFGPTTCPIVEVLAVCRWFDLDERGVVDTESRSDFDVAAVNASLSVVSAPQRKGAEDARRAHLRGTANSRPRVDGAEPRPAVELVLKTTDGANGSPHALSILRECAPYLKCRLENVYGLTFHAADTFNGVVFLLLTHLRALAVSNGANYNNNNNINNSGVSSSMKGHKELPTTSQEEGDDSEDDEAAARRDELHLRNWRAVEEEPRATQEAFRSLVRDILNTDPIPPLPVTSRCVTSLWEKETLEIENSKSLHLRSSSSPSLSLAAAGGDIRTTYIPNSFLNRCAHYAGKVLTHPDDVFILWLEAVEGLRKPVWEYLEHPRPNFESAMRSLIGVGLAGDAETVPDLDAPLIMQKMQMLHYCLFQHEQGVVAKANKKPSGRARPDESTTNASPADATEHADGWDADGIDFESCTENSSEGSASPLHADDHQSGKAKNRGQAGGRKRGGWDEDDDLSFGSEEDESTDSDERGDLRGAATKVNAERSNGGDENEGFEPLSEAEETVSGSAALERKMRKTKGNNNSSGGGGIRDEDYYSYFSSRQRTEQFRDGDNMKSRDGEISNDDDGDDECDGPRSQDGRHHHRLLLRHGEEMIVPPPRRVTPKTRDVIEAEQAELYKLGTAAAGASARMWLQTRVLKDDMVYFRACQPQGATVDFVDFVRWHSPKDYVGPPFDSPDLSVAERDEMRREAALQPTTRLISIRMGGQGGSGESVNLEKSKDKPAELYREEGGTVAATYNTWLSLWEEACAVIDPSYLEDAFHPELEARRILSWLADCVTTEDVLVHFTIATAANALHRMACHPMVIIRNRGSEETSLENADDFDHKDPTTVSENNNNNNVCPLKSYLRYVAAEMARVGKGMSDQMALCKFEAHSDVEAIKGGTTALTSLIREAELAVSAALSLRLFLVEGRRCANAGGEDGGKGKNAGQKSVPAWAIQRLLDELAQCSGAIAMTGLDDLRSKAHTTMTMSSDILSSRRANSSSSRCVQPPAIDIVAISPSTFWCVVAPLLSSSSSSSLSKSSNLPSETKYALRCEAERPMHSEPTLQRLLVTTDRHRTCRIAMALTEEVY